MQVLISHASPFGPRCSEAVHRLQLPKLHRLLQYLSPVSEVKAVTDGLTPVHELVLAELEGLGNARHFQDGLVPWALHDAFARGLTQLHGLDGWAWITPCHWNVQSDHVSMSDPGHLALTRNDANQLRAAMQPYFSEDGITLFAIAQDQPLGRWLAHGKVFNDLPTASLDRVIGRAVDHWLPRQSQAASLRRLQNEMQMLLHTHPVNEQRERQKLPTINSFWISGTGTYQPVENPDNPVVVTMRDALRKPSLEDDSGAWIGAWKALDETTIAHALQKVESGESVRLTLCGEHRAQTWGSEPLGFMGKLQRRLKPVKIDGILQSL